VRHPLRALAAAATLLAASACVTTTTTAYVPTPGQPRLTTDDARDEIDALLRAECPRLVQAGKPSSEARVSVDVDASGNVSSARLQTSSGDEQMDRIFGGTAARLHFTTSGESSSATTAGRLRMGWSCSGDAAVTTIQLL
jgi:TonB family protein